MICEICEQRLLESSNLGFLDIINATSQVVMAIAAIVAIIITIKQIRHKGKANIKASYMCGLGLLKKDSGETEIIAGVNIKVINLGLSPVYIEQCGIEFVDEDNNISSGLMTTNDIVCVQPGENYNGSIHMIELMLNDIEDRVNVNDNVYVYVKLCNGKKQRWKTGKDYRIFKSECIEFINEAKKNSMPIK